MDIRLPLAIQDVGEVVQRRDALWVEAARERPYGFDLLLDPLAGVEGDFDVRLPEHEDQQEGDDQERKGRLQKDEERAGNGSRGAI